MSDYCGRCGIWIGNAGCQRISERSWRHSSLCTGIFRVAFAFYKSDSGIRVSQILEHPETYIDSKEYASWERFFTALLVNRTQGNPLWSYSEIIDAGEHLVDKLRRHTHLNCEPSPNMQKVHYNIQYFSAHCNGLLPKSTLDRVLFLIKTSKVFVLCIYITQFSC